MANKTGIICTMGPSTRSAKIIKSLSDNGMTVARLNFSHGTFEQYEKDIALIRSVNKKYKRNIKILYLLLAKSYSSKSSAKRNIAPPPLRFSAPISPPCAFTIVAHTDKPIPALRF